MVSHAVTQQGEAELRIFDFKTTWSKSQKVSQTATEQGKAEQCIFDFKTTWSEFQMPSQTVPAEAKPRCVYSILKQHGQSFITSPELVQSSCVRQHTQDVPAKRVLPSKEYFISYKQRVYSFLMIILSVAYQNHR